MENLENMDWEEITPPENAENEIRQIQKNLRRRNWKIILTSLVLIAALLLSVFYVAIPLAETLYWSPKDCTVDQDWPDLNLVVIAYTELFKPGFSVSMLSGDAGFAKYDLKVTLHDTIRDERQYISGSLDRGSLSFDWEMYDQVDFGLFRSARLTDPYPQAALDQDIAQVRQQLSELPEYVEVEAAITFAEDLTMEQLMTLLADHHFFNSDLPVEIHWVAVRTHGAEETREFPESGFSFNIALGRDDLGINEVYPEFALSTLMPDGKNLEEHYKSLLKFSSDQMALDHGVIKWVSYNYYDEVLAYVEENGVKTYGCIVTGSPKALLNLLDSENIKDLQLMDAWISVE